MYFVLPNNPQTAKFLTPEERKLAFARVQGMRHSADTRKWKTTQFKEALMDPRSWLFFLLNVFITLPGGGLSAVSLSEFHRQHQPRESDKRTSLEASS